MSISSSTTSNIIPVMMILNDAMRRISHVGGEICVSTLSLADFRPASRTLRGDVKLGGLV